MMVLRLLLFSFFNFYFLLFSTGQTDSSHLRISILTCTPGEDLYSTFGHSAVRITDSTSHDDIVYNYGTFDFDEPGFYTKFIRGKLTFYLSTEDFDSFLYFYQQEKRGMTEQVLNLTGGEKQNIVRLLQANLMPDNRYYKYDFTFDNCTTRLRDLMEKTADTTVSFGKVLQSKKTFRDLIYEYLNYNDKQWSKLGIDLLLGSKMDVVMTSRQVMFLPDYLMETFNKTNIGYTPIVVSSKSLYKVPTQNKQQNIFTHPEFIFGVLFLLIVVMSFSKNNSLKKLISGFDGFIFFITGLMGVLFLIMWFGTDHIMCKNNYNLLWAWPTHAIFAFYINSRKFYAKNYYKLTAFANSILLITWFFLPQHLNTSLIPIVMLLIFRSAMIGYKIKEI